MVLVQIMMAHSIATVTPDGTWVQRVSVKMMMNAQIKLILVMIHKVFVITTTDHTLVLAQLDITLSKVLLKVMNVLILTNVLVIMSVTPKLLATIMSAHTPAAV